jgi:hypothetical protein
MAPRRRNRPTVTLVAKPTVRTSDCGYVNGNSYKQNHHHHSNKKNENKNGSSTFHGVQGRKEPQGADT